MFKSFTFRIGVLFFLAVASILIGFRLFSFQQLIASTEDDIRSVILAHTAEVERGVERDGPRYAVYLIEALAQQSDDPHLVLALQSGEVLHGNLRAWPDDVLQGEPGWYETNVALMNRQGIIKARIYTEDLKGGQRLIVGYDLIRISQIKRALVASLIQNIWISVFASLGLTFILLYAISIYLEKMNSA